MPRDRVMIVAVRAVLLARDRPRAHRRRVVIVAVPRRRGSPGPTLYAGDERQRAVDEESGEREERKQANVLARPSPRAGACPTAARS